MWIGFKTTLKRTTVRIFQIKSQNIFFLFVKKTVFRKRIFMLLLLRKSITDVPVHRDWGTFGILRLSVGFTWGAKFSNISLTGPVESNTAGMGQVSNLWKKNGMGLFKRVRQSEIGERDEREGWRAKKLMNENNGRGRLNKQMNAREKLTKKQTRSSEGANERRNEWTNKKANERTNEWTGASARMNVDERDDNRNVQRNEQTEGQSHARLHARTYGWTKTEETKRRIGKRIKRMKSWKATKAVNNESYYEFTMPKTYFATAFDRIPILLSLGGIDECPAEVCTLSSSVM